MLGFEDHGIFTCMIHLDYGGAGQGFGGYCLAGSNDKDTDGNFPNNYGANFIKKILEVVGVEKWEDLVGKHVRVKAEHTKVLEIGNILEDEWFNPSTFK